MGSLQKKTMAVGSINTYARKKNAAALGAQPLFLTAANTLYNTLNKLYVLDALNLSPHELLHNIFKYMLMLEKEKINAECIDR